MSASIQASIYQHLLEAAAFVQAPGVYNFTMGKVLDHYPSPAELAPLPAVAIVPEDATVRALPCAVEECRARFAVTAWIDEPFGATGTERVGQLLDDLQTAFYADRTRDSQAIDTQITGVRFQKDNQRPLYRLQLKLTVLYHAPN